MNPQREQGGTIDAREEAIDAMTDVLMAEGVMFHPRAVAESALAALTSPRTVECDCGIPGEKTDGSWGTQFNPGCPSCSGSGRIEKGPIAYLAADLIPVLRARVKREQSGVPIGWRLGELIEPLYRLPDESPKGGA